MASRRIYEFPLPYEIGGIEAMAGVSRLQSAGVWEQIPEDLRTRLEACGPFAGGLTVTKADLDRIPTPAWTKIASMLNLKWK